MLSNFIIKTPGSHLVIQIVGNAQNFIAEVTQEEPLILKIEENGPFARLKNGDYIIKGNISCRIQDPEQEQAVLKEAVDRGHPLCSGLASLGVTDGKIHEIYPT